MKTTSYIISKRLAEIGFVQQCFWMYQGEDLCMPYSTDYHLPMYPAYELETILDAFSLKIGGYGYFSVGARKDNPSMPFAVGYNLECDDNYGMLFCDQLKGESLADTAARLLILLYEKGLITFGGK